MSIIIFLVFLFWLGWTFKDDKHWPNKRKNKMAKIGTPPVLKTKEDNEKDIERLIQQLFEQTQEGKKWKRPG